VQYHLRLSWKVDRLFSERLTVSEMYLATCHAFKAGDYLGVMELPSKSSATSLSIVLVTPSSSRAARIFFRALIVVNQR